MTTNETATADLTRERVQNVLREQFGPEIDGMPDDAELVDRLSDTYDSLAALECISRIEAEFGIEVDFVADDVRYWFATPGRIVQFVADRLEDHAALRAS